MSDFKRYPRFGKNWGNIVKMNEGKDSSLFMEVNVEGYRFYRYYDKPKEDDKGGDSTLRHIFSAILGQKTVDALLKSCTTWEEKLSTLLEAVPDDVDKIPMDIFLQWQWNFPKRKDGTVYDKTYLQLPSTVKAGPFICKRTKGYKFKKLDSYDEKTKDVLTYVNADGEVHPFSRNGWFMQSNWANRQENQVTDAPKVVSPTLEPDDDDLPF